MIVAYGDRIAYEETLDEALTSLFGEDTEAPVEPNDPGMPITGDTPDTIRDLINRANDLFNRAQESQRAGDWGEYGRNLDELQKVLERLNQLNTTEQE